MSLVFAIGSWLAFGHHMVIILRLILYRGFICKVLFCVNYAGLQILILQLLLCFCFNSVSVAVPYLVICLTYVSLQVLQKCEHFISALLFPFVRPHTDSVNCRSMHIRKFWKQWLKLKHHIFLGMCPTTVIPLHIAAAKGFCWLYTSRARRQYQHFSNKTRSNILVNMVSSDHRVYCKGFYFRCYCTCRAQWFLTRSPDWKGLQI